MWNRIKAFFRGKPPTQADVKMILVGLKYPAGPIAFGTLLSLPDEDRKFIIEKVEWMARHREATTAIMNQIIAEHDAAQAVEQRALPPSREIIVIPANRQPE